RALGHLERFGLAENRRHLHGATQHQRREVHRDLAIQIVPVAPEELVVAHLDHDVEIAGRSTGGPMLALALQPQPLTGGDACRDLHGELALSRDPAFTVARRTRFRDDLPDAAALMARPGNGEEALLVAKLTATTARGARGRRRSWRGAAASAGVAGLGAGKLDRRFSAARGFLERDLEIVAEVRALLRSTASSVAAEHISEAEQIAQPPGDVLEAGEGGWIEAALRADARMAEAIVGGALLRIGQHRVRLGRLLEMLLGVLAALIAVGMVLERKLAVGGLQLRVGCAATDAQDLVVIAPGHAVATFTIAGRSRRSPSRQPR